MDILKIALINLPEHFYSPLATLINEEHLGASKIITCKSTCEYFNTALDDTNFIIIYDKAITEELLCTLSVPVDIPVILLTEGFSFEMERTAKSYNIDLLVNINDPEVFTIIYGFVNQYHIYQSQHALIVDDSRVDSCIVAKSLSHEFIKSTIELDPENVITVLKNSPSINLVILDYEMPKINGCQLMKNIKEAFPNREFIFIGITASRNAAIKFLYDAADEAFIKPLDLEMFSVTLRKLVFHSHREQLEKQSLSEYKRIIASVTKDVYNPVYILSTINDILIDSASKTEHNTNASLLCKTAKEKIHKTFADLQSYLELSQYLHDPALKPCSLHAMIAGQLYVESSKAKIKNVIINESIDVSLRRIRVPNQVEQVISNLTQHAINKSAYGSNVYIRLYPEQFNIVFEVENSSDLSSSQAAITECQSNNNALNIVVNEKIIDSLGGSMGERAGENGMISYFKLPSYALTPDNISADINRGAIH